MKEPTKEDYQKAKEIYDLYNITEAETHLLLQLVVMIQMMGFSRKLTVKLMQAATAMIDMIHDEDEK